MIAPLVPSARRTSRVLVIGAIASGVLLDRVPGGVGERAQQGLVLAALALGMPHGAADTELIRLAAHGSRPRHVGLAAAYALLATGAAAVVGRGGPGVDRVVLAASAAHFTEGELACWTPPPAGRHGLRTALRAVAAATMTVLLPAAVATANRRPLEVGLTGAAAQLPVRSGRPAARAVGGRSTSSGGGRPAARAVGGRSGLRLLRNAETRRTVAPLSCLAALAVGALSCTGDREAAADSALLLALDLLAPPSSSFAAYFGGWHALRHTARVVDALVAQGQLPEQRSLAGAVGVLGRRSAWAAGIGLVAAGVLALRDPEHASDNAFAAVLGLTVPHMTAVALELGRRPSRPPFPAPSPVIMQLWTAW